MSFVPSLIATLIGVFTANALNQKLSQTTDPKTNETVIKNETGEIVARLPNETSVRLEPFDIFTADIDRITTNATAKPDKPQIEFENPYKQDLILTSLSFVPDLAFQTKGKAIIKIGGNSINISSASLTDSDSLNVPLPPNGIKIKRTDKIQIFAWNGVDAVNVSLTSLVGIGGYLG